MKRYIFLQIPLKVLKHQILQSKIFSILSLFLLDALRNQLIKNINAINKITVNNIAEFIIIMKIPQLKKKVILNHVTTFPGKITTAGSSGRYIGSFKR